MNYTAIINDLNYWDKDEIIYRDYFYVQHNNLSVEDFLSRYPSNNDETEIAMHPEVIITYAPEEAFISSGRNVFIVKHPRYLPLFFHEHAFFEIIYVLSGQCTQLFHGQKIYLSKGDLFFVAPNVIHGIEVFDEDSIVLNILIRRSTFLNIFFNTVRDKSQISLFFLENIYAKMKIRYAHYHTDEDDVIRNYILDMYLEQINADEYSDGIICSMLTIFFNQLTRRHKKSLEIPDAYKQNDTYRELVISYMINNYATVTLNELAAKLHFSVPYCSKLIKEISGYTFSELLTNIRLQQGANFLMLTQLSVADISDRVGYKNPESFIRSFKRYYKETPSQYRKLNNPSVKHIENL